MEPAAPTLASPAEAPPEVWERPVPGPARALLWLLVAGSFLVPPGAAVLAMALAGLGPTRGGTPEWLSGPFGPFPAVGSALALLALGLVMDKLWLAHARRRWGRCELRGEELSFAFDAGLLGGAEERVPLQDVTGFAVGPHGVLVEVLGRARLDRWVRPLLIPTRDDAEVARALARLEAPREGPPGAASFGQARPAWFWLVPFAGLLLLLYGLLGLIAARQGIGPALALALPLLVALVAWVWLLERQELGPRWRPLHLGRAALLVGRERVVWGEVARAGFTGQGELAAETAAPPRRILARVAPRQDEARALLERRLREAGAALRLGPPPAWAAAPARARRRRWLLALLLAPLGAGLAVALADLPLYDELRLADDDGTALRLVYRRSDDMPRLCSIVVGGAEEPGAPEDLLIVPSLLGARRFGGMAAEVRLDLAAGRARGPDGGEHGLAPGVRLHLFDGATAHGSAAQLPPAFTRRLRDARGLGVESVPALLDGLALPDDPLLAAWTSGRLGRRTFERVDARGWRLTWGAARGEVLFCVLSRVEVDVEVAVRGCLHYASGAGTLQVQVWDETLPLARVDAAGRVAAFPGPLPDLEHLLEVDAAVRGGATLRAASPELRALEEAR